MMNDSRLVDIEMMCSEPAIFEQFAEELLEFSKECLKYARKLRNENPTPRGYDEIHQSLIEEYADCKNCLEVLEFIHPHFFYEEDVKSIIDKKRDRWLKRLRGESK